MYHFSLLALNKQFNLLNLYDIFLINIGHLNINNYFSRLKFLTQF